MAAYEAKTRPDPDALLALASGDRGRFTLFLGAAPGVGKTYAMLSRARKLVAEGVDVVVGLAETHGRTDTANLIEGLEVLPRKTIDHEGLSIEEFDIDAALARKPKVIIVDELAHTNAPGSRHPKRYLDVKELLAAGIDVWSAMNVQHLESLSDVVQQITGILVRERVPDTMLQGADDILLVDLEPNALIERLKEGKVYVPENARRAIDSFFKVGNLTALREMALRRTADRVDDQVVDYLRQNAIEDAWQTSERLLVCIGPDALSEKVIRTAARLASGLNAPWLVITIERLDRTPPSPETNAAVDGYFKLATSLGAETRRVTGSDFVDEILKAVRREHVTQIVIGASRASFFTRWFKRSLLDALTEQVAGTGIHIVTGEALPQARKAGAPVFRARKNRLLQFALPLATVTVATIMGSMGQYIVDLPNASLLYMLAVILSAIHAGYAAALGAAALSALAYNFFFIPPVEAFTIASPHEVFALAVFIVAALIAGGLASRVSEQAAAAHARAVSTQSLYDFSKKLSGTVKADDVAWATVSQLHGALLRDVILLTPAGKELEAVAAWPPDMELDITDMTAARWAAEKGEISGKATGTLPNSHFQFRPVGGPTGIVAVVGLRLEESDLDAPDEKTLDAIIEQAAVAIDRARLSKESLDQVARQASERFRSALLSSISHDLKTPLATISGAISSLRELGGRMKPETRLDLLMSIEEESDRLNRFVSNLLDMTKIQAGTVAPQQDWVDVADVIHGALQRAAKYFPTRKIDTSLAKDLPLVRGDSVLLGQTLFNLLDNAIKHGGGEPVSVYARIDGNKVAISVTDLGKGIPAKELDRVFEKFFRRGRSDGRAPGTGLGLAIAKGFVEAMGGTIHAESPAVKKQGTRIVIRLPIPDELPSLEST